MCYYISCRYDIQAGVAEWQTQQTQNLPGATSCRFKSGHRHKRSLTAPFFMHTGVQMKYVSKLTDARRGE